MLIKEKGKSSCYTSSMETQLPKRNNATKIKPRNHSKDRNYKKEPNVNSTTKTPKVLKYKVH